MGRKIKLISILGQTGTGKTALSLFLSQHFPISIINFDSRQVYEDLPIVTAQPSVEEKSKAPHYLFGFLPLNKKVTAGDFVAWARERIEEESKKERIPVLVGGTGLYLRALLFGLSPIPKITEKIKEQIAEKLKKEGLSELYRELREIDPTYAAKIHPKDKQRITRALEVFYQTQKPFSAWHQLTPKESIYECIKIGLRRDLEELTPILVSRIEKMIELGAIEEVRKAIEKYKDTTLPGFTGIGVKEIVAYLENKMSFAEMQQEWLKNTRAYAKRQVTWFKKEKNVLWLPPLNKEDILSYLIDWLR